MFIIDTPPIIKEIIPQAGPPNTKIVIIGANFREGKNLKVMLGDFALSPEFFESGTLIVTVPEILNSNYYK